MEQFLNMIQAMKIRHCLDQNTCLNIIEYTKILAGPHFTEFSLSDYYMKKVYNPIDHTSLYTFYCPEDDKVLIELVTKEELNRIKNIACPACKKIFSFDSTNKNYYINIDLEYQIKSLLVDPNILDHVIETYDSRKHMFQKNNCKTHDASNTITYSDIFDGEIYKRNQFIHVRNSKRDVVLTMCINIDGGTMFHKTIYALWPILSQINEFP